MEALAIIALVVGLAATVGAALRRGGVRSRSAVPAQPPAPARPVASPIDNATLDSAMLDEAELEAIFARAAREFDGAVLALLAARLRPVVLRRVPVKAIRPAPAPSTARVLFADGTVVIARGLRPGDLGQLSVGVLTHPSVCLVSYRRENDETRLEFVLSPDRRLSAVAVGLDQAD